MAPTERDKPPGEKQTGNGARDLNCPTGTHGLIAVDKVGVHVRFFDPSSYKEIANLDIGVRPHELAISPDHRTAYVTIYGDGIYGRNPHPGHSIAIIDLASKQLVGSIDTLPYLAPHGITVDAAGMLYVTCDQSRALLVIDPRKRSVEAAIDTEGTGHWHAVLPDGTKAYIANKGDRPFVSVLDLQARKMTGRVPTPNGTEGITVSPDGKRVIAADHLLPELIVIDTESDTVRERVRLKDNPVISASKDHAIRPRFTLDGTRVVTSNYSSAVVNVLEAENLRGSQQLLIVEKGPMGFAFAEDRRTALVANHDNGTVSVLDLEGKVLGDFDSGIGVETLAFY